MLILPAPSKIILLASSAVAVTHTGNTSETVLATVTIPAGVMGLNGALRIWALWSTPGGSGNNKLLKGRIGGLSGTIIQAATVTTTLSFSEAPRTWQNRNSAASQVCRNTSNTGVGTLSNAVTTTTVDTTAAQDLVFTAQLASAGESITLEQYLVELILP